MSDADASPRSRRAARRRAWWVRTSLVCAAAIVVAGMQPAHLSFARAPFNPHVDHLALISAAPAPTAFGESGEVKLRLAMPGAEVEYPLGVNGEVAGLRYQWVSIADSLPADSARPLAGADVTAPSRPGFYRLALLRDTVRRVLAEPTLGVLVPFEQKSGAMLGTYRIGTYVAERLRNRAHERPEGFLEVQPNEVGLKVSEHLTLADFLTHDGQRDVWPKYVALSPRLLDKIELVIGEVSRVRASSAGLAFGVHSGFRAPAHNAQVRRAASDSRHQYGDAADVVMDADGDGRITAADSRLVALAVEMIEQRYPDLAGGLGLYTSRRYRTPYVHIDARGVKRRWRG